jgi:hypothetical protein
MAPTPSAAGRRSLRGTRDQSQRRGVASRRSLVAMSYPFGRTKGLACMRPSWSLSVSRPPRRKAWSEPALKSDIARNSLPRPCQRERRVCVGHSSMPFRSVRRPICQGQLAKMSPYVRSNRARNHPPPVSPRGPFGRSAELRSLASRGITRSRRESP